MPIRLFIGGPIDGQIMQIPGDAKVWNIPVMDSAKFLRNGLTGSTTAEHIKTVQYHRDTIKSREGGEHVFFTCLASELVIKLLLDNYKPNKGEHAGRR
jgi:hypothetical protein